MIQFCAYCGKAFQVFGGVWGYAYGGLYTCSYKCMRAMKEEDSVTEEQKRIVDELEGKGLTAREIAAKAGVNPQNVFDYRRRKKLKAAAGNEGDPSREDPSQAQGALAKRSLTREGFAPQDDRKKSEERAKEETPEAKAPRETMADRYKYGWMCPMCRMVWSPWISACNCQRKEEVGVSV